VSNQLPRRDPWRWPSLLLWTLFFLLGFWPEFSFYALRTAGYVFSQNAIINSYHFITWCLTGYVMHFAYHRSLEAGLPPLEALGKSIQLGVLAFVAFIDMPFQQIGEIRNAVDRALVLGMAFIKFASWIYLYSLFARYHWHRRPEIIAHCLGWLSIAINPAPENTAEDSRAKGGGKQAAPAPLKEQAD